MNESSTGNRQPATGDPQRATGNRQPATGNPQRATGNRQPTTGNPQRAAGNRQPTTGNPQRATGNRQPTTGNRSGALLLDKPVGPTSHDAVACARRALGERSIGHTGTLDPLASGLLVLLCGRATRLASLMTGASKTYDATVRLGIETDTYDAAGTPRPAGGVVAPADVDEAAIEAAVAEIREQRRQVPPAFSAKKVAGVRAYTLARRNEAPALDAVDVRVHAIAWARPETDVLLVTLTCSAGYYVRSMAHEIGQRLGCGAHLAALRRTAVGPFRVEDAITLDALNAADRADAASRILPMEALLAELPAVVLTEAGERRARHGNTLGMQHVAEWRGSGTEAALPARYRVLAGDGTLVAIAETTPAGLQPAIVLAPA